MKQIACIEEEYFLSALRDGGTFSGRYELTHGKPDTLPGQKRRGANMRDLARLISGQPGEPTTGGELVSDLLQAYTDEWLATGIDPDTGKELPFSRKLTSTNHAQHAVANYEYRGLASNIDWDNGLERHPKPLRDRLIATMTMCEDVVRAAQLEAWGILHAFMEAPWRYRLGKCKRCNQYFVLQNNPPKIPYVRGMHCSKCKNTASAKASAKVKREIREELLMGFAVDAWTRWPRRGVRNEWVAEQVSKALGKKRAIQQNWVTRHEQQIEAEVKRMAHAKS